MAKNNKHNLKLDKEIYSETTLSKFAHLFDSWDWYYVLTAQSTSNDFLKRNLKNIGMYSVIFEKLKDNTFVESIISNNEIDNKRYEIGHACIYCNFSEDFIIKNIKKLNVHSLLRNPFISNEIKEEIKLLKEII